MLKTLKVERSISSSSPSNGATLNGSKREKILVSKGKRRGVFVAILAIGAIWAFSDDANHRYVAVNRTLRVFYALVRCLREYGILCYLGTFSNARMCS